MPTISPSTLTDFATSLLAAGGATDAEARIVGHSLVSANLRGYESHGVMRTPFYIGMIQRGETISTAVLEILNESPTRLVADANWGFGRVQAGRLLERLIEKANDQGMGIGTLLHSSHIGRLGEYCEIAAEQGLVSMLMVNTHGAVSRVAPPGGCAPRLGTNPMALGVPHQETPLILDFSTSATAEGKVRVKQIAGEACPDGWLIDNQGNPTTDPNDLYTDPPGAIVPMGGEQAYKGFGLSFMIDIFSGALSGGLCARETPETPKGNCVFMMILAPQHFGGTTHFTREVEGLASYVRACPRRDGVEEILLPGDPERKVMRAHAAQGIVLDEGNWQQLTELAEKLQVPLPTLS